MSYNYEVMLEVNSYVNDISFMWGVHLFTCRTLMFGRVASKPIMLEPRFAAGVDKHPSFRDLHLNVTVTDKHSISRLRSEIDLVRNTIPGKKIENATNIILSAVGLQFQLAGAFPVFLDHQRLPGSPVAAQFYVDTYARINVRGSHVDV